MANVTLEVGYLPECSGLEPEDFSADRAANVDFRQLGYYVSHLDDHVMLKYCLGCWCPEC